MTVLRSECTGRWPVHFFQKLDRRSRGPDRGCADLRVGFSGDRQLSRRLSRGQSVADFYRGRNDNPFWLAANAGDAADQFLTLLASSNIDGINPAKYNVPALRDAVAAARSGGKRKQVAEADHALSEAFVDYVADLRQDPGVGITYVDGVLRPSPPSPLAALLSAGSLHRLPTMCTAWGGCIPITRSFVTRSRPTPIRPMSRPAPRDQPRTRSCAASGQAALRPGQRRAAAALHVREWEAG